MSRIEPGISDPSRLGDPEELPEIPLLGVVGSVDLYLIQGRRPMVFLAPRSVEACIARDGNRVRHAIRRLLMSRRSVVRWLGRVIRIGYRYYQKLEDQIDPQERMVKALGCPEDLRVWYGSMKEPELQFRDFLRGQSVKHAIWMVVDSILTVGALSLAWLPGPNVLGWYPFLRAVSHYRASKGARKVLGGIPTRFEEMPQIADLESRMRSGGDLGEAVAAMGIDGLEKFLKRVR